MSGFRLVAAGALAALGLTAAAGGFLGLSLAAYHGIGLLRDAGTTAETQRFAFDRLAWQAVPVDDLFPTLYRSTTAAPLNGAERVFTRIGLAPPADCRSAFDPDLVRLLAAHPCGPVLRAGYTDATQTLVATVGVAFLGTTPAAERDISAATTGQHDDLRPRALSFSSTAAATFGDAQRVAFRVFADPGGPFVAFAVTGFADGRPASADPGRDAVDQSGALLMAIDLEAMVDLRIETTTDALRARAR